MFYIADMNADGVHLIDGDQMKKIGFIRTGNGAHGLYVSRDSKMLYVTNRNEGSISLVDFKTQSVVKNGSCPAAEARTWAGSPPMAKCSGLPADTTPRSMPSIPMTAISSRKFQSERALTGFACIRSREGTPWGTPGSLDK